MGATQSKPSETSSKNAQPGNEKVCYSCEYSSGNWRTYCIRNGVPLNTVVNRANTCRKM